VAALRARPALAALLVVVLCGCVALEPWREPTENAPRAADVLLRIAACGPGTPLAEVLSAALTAAQPGLAIDITRGDSPAPVDLLRDGQADLAIVALPAEGATPPDLPAAWADYHPALLGVDALGVFVHAGSALRAVSTEQLRHLYGGYVLDWSALEAGAGQPEWVVTQPGSASRALFEERILGGEAPSPATLLVPSDRAAVDHVAEHPLALAVASVAALDEGVALVALDGVLPTARNVARGDYPHTWALYALVSPQAPEGAAQWLAYARSNAGREIIGQRYALPR